MQGELQAQLLEYLQKPGFQRLWPAVKDKLERLDRVGGKIRLTHLSSEEREALQGLLAVNLHAQESCSFNLKNLDAALRETRFEVSLEECISLLFGASFLSHRRAQQEEQDFWDAFCTWALAFVTRSELKTWAVSLAHGKGTGYRTFRECFAEFQDMGSSTAWKEAAAALEALPVWYGNEVDMIFRDRQPRVATDTLSNAALRWVRLPVFAAKTIGDPHGLDRSGLTGRLFYWGLIALDDRDHLSSNTEGSPAADFASDSLEYGQESQSSSNLAAITVDMDSEAVRALYHRFGILLDDISSTVLAVGITEDTKLPAALTLWTVDRLHLIDNPGAVFVVENPSIFGTILETFRNSEFTPKLPYSLICTSGRPSTAALHLLDKVVCSGGTIYYSGDLDVAGLQIAVSLAARYGANFVAWRMRAKDYLQVVRQSIVNLPRLSVSDTKVLSSLHLPWEAEGEFLPLVMLSAGVKVFQEQLVDELVNDYFNL